jgi:3'-phosphoadenosine 5'-phosphosulfate sulfotransferase (PAPS reductase)/FAD synthetase
VAPGDDIRAGRWWWEAPEHKECGLHARRIPIVAAEAGPSAAVAS